MTVRDILGAWVENTEAQSQAKGRVLPFFAFAPFARRVIYTTD